MAKSMLSHAFVAEITLKTTLGKIFIAVMLISDFFICWANSTGVAVRTKFLFDDYFSI